MKVQVCGGHLVHTLLGFAAVTAHVTMDFKSGTFCIQHESRFLSRFLLRTQKLRVTMERMIQPSARCVAEVIVRIACCCAMAVMQGKKDAKGVRHLYD